jgi:epi-isozizaene 5-monooxygenase
MELYHELERMVLDFGARALFSRTFSDERLDWVVAATHFADDRFAALMTPYWLPTLANLKFWGLKREYHALVQELIDDRRASGEPADDLLDRLITTNNPETDRAHTDQEMHDQIFSAYFGTAALTQTLLVGLHFLATRPEMMQKLRSELAEIVGDRAPAAADLHQLHYLQMFVQEVLRAYPSFWGSPRYADKPIELDGYRFPARSTFLMMRFAAQRHPEFWERPTEFVPERHETRNACPHAPKKGRAGIQAGIQNALASVKADWRQLGTDGSRRQAATT